MISQPVVPFYFAFVLPFMLLSGCGVSGSAQTTGVDDAGGLDSGPPADTGFLEDRSSGNGDSNGADAWTADICIPNCGSALCGDDGCGGSCGTCTGANDVCVAGSCECTPDCDGKTCGDNGCGGNCGECNPQTHECTQQQCVPLACETAVCDVCDEIDVGSIVGAGGTIGGGHTHALNLAVFNSWPITSDVEIFSTAGGTAFRLHHFPGQPNWPSVTDTHGTSYAEAAVIVACWDKTGVGIYCSSGEHWTMDHNNGVRGMDWPADRPVAWLLVSSGAQKRTAIKYFETWPHNNLSPDHALNASTVGTGLDERLCR